MNLAEKAMLADIHISQWSARKTDKEESQKVTRENNADVKAARVTKALVDPEAAKAVSQTATAIRQYHAWHTLPWSDTGPRILPARHFEEYRPEINRLIDEFHAAADHFATRYATLVEQAHSMLGGLFSPGDYPCPQEIRAKYSATTEIMPMPDALDFRIALGDDIAAEIREEIAATAQRNHARGMADLWKRLHMVCSRMAEDLPQFRPHAKGAERGTFRNSLVQNAVELCAILPALNVNDDERLEEARREVEEKLCAHSAKQLREDPVARNNTAEAAKDLLDKMAGYTGE